MVAIQKKYFYLYFGFIAGLVFILFNELSNSILKNAGGITSIIGMLAHFSILLYSLKYFIKNYSEGYLSFGQAYKKALFISIIGGIFNSTYTYIAFKLKPALLVELKVLTEDAYLNSGIPADDVEMLSQLMETYLTPVTVAMSSFFLIFFGGLLLSLIVSSMVKKEQNPLENAK